MRRAARIDANQTAIVKALQSIGCSVAPLSMIGKGVPDLLVGFRNRNLLLEIKDGDKSPSRQALTPDQIAWRLAWRGQTAIVTNIDEAIREVSKA